MGSKFRVLKFFDDIGARVSVPRQTLSRMLELAFPTLDMVIGELIAEGKLESSCVVPDQYCLVRGHVFKSQIAKEQKKAADEEKRRASLTLSQDNYHRNMAAWRERQRATAALRKADQEAIKARKLAIRLEDRAQAVEERQKRRAKKQQDKRDKADRLKVFYAHQREKVLAKVAEECEARRVAVEAETRTQALIVVPQKPKPKQAEAPQDPWAIIRERRNAKPKMPEEPSTIRKLTRQELMGCRA